jgi:lipoprotein NlpD
MLSTSFLQSVKLIFRVIIILNASLWLSACFFSHNSAPTTDVNRTSNTISSSSQQHIVKSGETLYSIAWRYGLDYKRLARANNIGNDFLIRPGQSLNLRIGSASAASDVSTKTYNTSSSSASATASSKTKTSSKAKTVSQPSKLSTGSSVAKASRSEKKSSTKNQVAKSKLSSARVVWRWPARGEVVTNFSVKNTTNKGIDIKGKKGDSVRAAASGSVVYAGSGLRGYGKLVIIKHSDMYLSAYAHNSKIGVKEGQYVKAGQYIANIGSSGSRTDSAKLHFEIRRNGKPVDPLRLLPRR